jgi:hypothetical protein
MPHRLSSHLPAMLGMVALALALISLASSAL